MTRDDVLDALEEVHAFECKPLERGQVPVYFWRDHIGIVLPASCYSADERIRMEGQFQYTMSRRHAHAFLEFSKDWRGSETPLKGGFD